MDVYIINGLEGLDFYLFLVFLVVILSVDQQISSRILVIIPTGLPITKLAGFAHWALISVPQRKSFFSFWFL